MAPRRPPTPPGVIAEDDVGLTSPPSLVQLMARIEANHADQMRLLQQIERNTAAHQNDRVTIKVQYEETRQRPCEDAQPSGSVKKRRVLVKYRSLPQVAYVPMPTETVQPQLDNQPRNFNGPTGNTGNTSYPPANAKLTCSSCGQPHYSSECPQKCAKGNPSYRHADLTCFTCGQPGHYMSECPQKVARNTSKSSYRPSNLTCFSCGQPGHYSTECTQKVAGRGRLNHVSIDAAQGGLSVIPGMVRVNLIPATILLHFGTSHTFLSEEFDKLHGLSSFVRVETR
jgi:cellular nucleic acid-binding protein